MERGRSEPLSFSIFLSQLFLWSGIHGLIPMEGSSAKVTLALCTWPMTTMHFMLRLPALAQCHKHALDSCCTSRSFQWLVKPHEVLLDLAQEARLTTALLCLDCIWIVYIKDISSCTYIRTFILGTYICTSPCSHIRYVSEERGSIATESYSNILCACHAMSVARSNRHDTIGLWLCGQCDHQLKVQLRSTPYGMYLAVVVINA